jgi:hypothetical protein
MAKAAKGRKYTYNHEEGHGFGRHHAGEDLLAEMRELDLHSGEEVKVLEFDADSGWPIVQWTDRTGQSRHTTVDPEFFTEHFTGA